MKCLCNSMHTAKIKTKDCLISYIWSVRQFLLPSFVASDKFSNTGIYHDNFQSLAPLAHFNYIKKISVKSIH